MRQYKIMARILLILPIINFAFALPIETRQVCGDVVPRADVTITMSTKRGDETQEQVGMYTERLSGRPDSDLAGLKGLLPEGPASDHGSMNPQVGTSEIQQGSPELLKSPSFNIYLASPKYESFGSGDAYVADSESGWSAGGGTASTGSSDPLIYSSKPKSKSFLSKVFSKFRKLKFWRRISDPGSVGDAVNAAQREFQGLVDTGTYVSASSLSPESQPF
jgi:hypothetical protein